MKMKPIRAPLHELEKLLEMSLERLPEENSQIPSYMRTTIKCAPEGFAGILEELIELKKKNDKE